MNVIPSFTNRLLLISLTLVVIALSACSSAGRQPGEAISAITPAKPDLIWKLLGYEHPGALTSTSICGSRTLIVRGDGTVALGSLAQDKEGEVHETWEEISVPSRIFEGACVLGRFVLLGTDGLYFEAPASIPADRWLRVFPASLWDSWPGTVGPRLAASDGRIAAAFPNLILSVSVETRENALRVQMVEEKPVPSGAKEISVLASRHGVYAYSSSDRTAYFQPSEKQEFESVSPPPGRARLLAADDSGVLWAAEGAQLWRSFSNGRKWEEAVLLDESGRVTALAKVSPVEYVAAVEDQSTGLATIWVEEVLGWKPARTVDAGLVQSLTTIPQPDDQTARVIGGVGTFEVFPGRDFVKREVPPRVLDLRKDRSDNQGPDYYVSFRAGQAPKPIGHAWVVLRKLDNNGRTLEEKAAGWFPAEKSPEVITGTKGLMKFDDDTSPVIPGYGFRVRLDADQYEKVKAELAKFGKGEEYQLVARDCAKLVETIARSLGLATDRADRARKLHPAAFVVALQLSALGTYSVSNQHQQYSGNVVLSEKAIAGEPVVLSERYVPHGRGRETYVDDKGQRSRYEGGFVYGEYGGPGRYDWADGSEFRGEFRNNRVDGEGVLNDAPRKASMKGRWRDGQPTGEFSISYRDWFFKGPVENGRLNGWTWVQEPDTSLHKVRFENGVAKEYGGNFYRPPGHAPVMGNGGSQSIDKEHFDHFQGMDDRVRTASEHSVREAAIEAAERAVEKHEQAGGAGANDKADEVIIEVEIIEIGPVDIPLQD